MEEGEKVGGMEGGREREGRALQEKKCVRLQHQVFLVMQTNCKHFYSLLGPYIDGFVRGPGTVGRDGRAGSGRRAA